MKGKHVGVAVALGSSLSPRKHWAELRWPAASGDMQDYESQWTAHSPAVESAALAEDHARDFCVQHGLRIVRWELT